MARSSRYDLHLIAESYQDGVYSDTGKPRMRERTLCGDDSIGGVIRKASDPKHVQCSECSRVYAKGAIKALGVDLKATPWTEGRSRKSANLAMLDGKPFAFLLLDHGWDKEWKIRPLTVSLDANFDAAPDLDDISPGMAVSGVHYGTVKAKELALLRAYEAYIAGSLPSWDAAFAHAKATKAAQVEAAARRLAAKAALEQEKADLVEALESIRCKAETGQITLTNFETESLSKAIALAKEFG
ncbi:hypothetical protein CcrC1_gp265c [Caulobacter phage C1]|nr:hypothetical protein CcrC1_gp265c [Caulobacter phage C1]UTU08494.1 hypothetical protein CcrC2_gp266c [Caulobacter phage C2]UTU09009.1 hypothetical protein CcrJ4_gp260c [Caulobacter phage J4]UTU10127.1 hypothetical protein CcrRB23_gp265c [Caulobacter phage RB23]WGN97161.1 hypothetical protein [Bertelyvirus sp.]